MRRTLILIAATMLLATTTAAAAQTIPTPPISPYVDCQESHIPGTATTICIPQWVQTGPDEPALPPPPTPVEASPSFTG